MIYSFLFRVFLGRLDPETAHDHALRLLRAMRLVPGLTQLMRIAMATRDDALRVRALGTEFSSPLGLAAGFDKSATSFDVLAALGFGSVEVGTVTSLPQPGRPRPRIERFSGYRALINRMGFPNSGCDAAATSLKRRRRSQGVVGLNVGKSAVTREDLQAVIDDYTRTVRACAEFVDYVALNVSSPNTHGLREFQTPHFLRALISGVQAALLESQSAVPLLVKISPDLSADEIDAIADLALELRVAGIIAVNTTTERDFARGVSIAPEILAGGGLSGRPLKARAVEVLRQLRQTVGSDVTLISVGGVENAEDVFERIRCGATLVQAHTGFVFGGPLWPRRLNRDLAKLVRAAGVASVQELVGADIASPPRLTPIKGDALREVAQI